MHENFSPLSNDIAVTRHCSRQEENSRSKTLIILYEPLTTLLSFTDTSLNEISLEFHLSSIVDREYCWERVVKRFLAIPALRLFQDVGRGTSHPYFPLQPDYSHKLDRRRNKNRICPVTRDGHEITTIVYKLAPIFLHDH